MPNMDSQLPKPAARGEAAGGTRTFSLFQRLLAGIALAALLASAAISSWWILDGRVDFVDSRGERPNTVANATDGRNPSGHREH